MLEVVASEAGCEPYVFIGPDGFAYYVKRLQELVGKVDGMTLPNLGGTTSGCSTVTAEACM